MYAWGGFFKQMAVAVGGGGQPWKLGFFIFKTKIEKYIKNATKYYLQVFLNLWHGYSG